MISVSWGALLYWYTVTTTFPLLCSLFDIAVSRSNLVERVASVDNWPEIPRLYKIRKQGEIRC